MLRGLLPVLYIHSHLFALGCVNTPVGFVSTPSVTEMPLWSVSGQGIVRVTVSMYMYVCD